MNLKASNAPFWWVFWHPYQGFWNRNLCKIIKKVIPIPFLSKFIITNVIRFDTFVLGVKLKLKTTNVNRSDYTPQKTINYFDLGTYDDACELRWVVDNMLLKLPNPYKIYAFEANPESFNKAETVTNNIQNLSLFNVALVDNIPESGKIQLFRGQKGLGDSIYKSNGGSFVDVPAKRISDIIKSEKIELEKGINILRMNIEGAEQDVIDDLIKNDLVKYFDGFYGMWDDVTKTDYKRGKKFSKTLKDQKIYPFPFNGRDMKIKARTNLIKKSLEKSIFGINEKAK